MKFCVWGKCDGREFQRDLPDLENICISSLKSNGKRMMENRSRETIEFFLWKNEGRLKDRISRGGAKRWTKSRESGSLTHRGVI